MGKLAGHFARVGGVLISPRATFQRIIEQGEGNLLELVPWIVVVTVIVAPIEAGRAILMLRVDVWEGVMAIVNTISNRMALAVAGAFGGGIVLYLGELVFRAKGEKRGLDLALDATAFTLVPYLLLVVVGALLSFAGAELWFMPHRILRGPPYYQAIRLAAGFGWSMILWGLMARMFWRRDHISSVKSA